MECFTDQTVEHSTGHAIKVSWTYNSANLSWRGWFGDGPRSTIRRRIKRNGCDAQELRKEAVKRYIDWLDAGPSYAEDGTWPKYNRTVARMSVGEVDANTDMILLSLNNEPKKEAV